MRFQMEVARTRMAPDEVLEQAVALGCTLTGAAGATVEMAEGPDLIVRAAAGLVASRLGARGPRAGTFTGRCLAEGTSRLGPEVPAPADPGPSWAGDGELPSLLAVPLHHEGNAIGALKVVSPEPGAFGEGDVEALSLLADVITAGLSLATAPQASPEAMEVAYRLATQDALTGLGNRTHFLDHLTHGLALARRQKHPVALAILTLEGLATLNEQHGHRTGDAALRAVAGRLRQATRTTDTLARVKGGTFGVLLRSVLDLEAAGEVGRKLRHQVAGPFAFEGRTHALEAAVGLALFPDEGLEAEALMALAESRLQAARFPPEGPR